MEPYHSNCSLHKSTPYNALTARCPKCRAAVGRSCNSGRHNALRYPHRERIESAAAEYRSEVRLQILEERRRHPWSHAFSSRRLADAGAVR